MTSASTTLYDVTDDVSDYVDDFDVLNFYVISINDVDVAFASPSHIVLVIVFRARSYRRLYSSSSDLYIRCDWNLAN